MERDEGQGQVHVIAGCMFAGKTTRLIQLMTGEAPARVAFKPALDSRYAQDRIVSHDGVSMNCVPVQSSRDLDHETLKAAGAAIAIDEAQFFDADLPRAVAALRAAGHRVYVAGLDQDAFGNPFGCMPALMELADVVETLSATCAACGEDARRSYRRPGGADDQIVVGGAEVYEPRCDDCWSPPRSVGQVA